MSGQWDEMVESLRACGIQFALGLSDTEVASTESKFDFKFPPDLRAFLQTALPAGKPFPDWRDGDEAILRDWLDRPREGVIFDVQHNGFWLPEWGERPQSMADAT